MSDFNIQFEEQDQSITLEFEQIGGGAVKSVNGKVGEVVLGASDVGALPSSTSIPAVDDTLTVTGAAADAKKTGDEITSLKEDYTTILDSAYVTDTASGSIASFPDGADNVLVKSLKVAIEPVQSGSGDPSPDNVRPISGHTQVVVTRTGKNLMKYPYESSGSTSNGITFTVNSDGTITMNGTATATAYFRIADDRSGGHSTFKLPVGNYVLSDGLNAPSNYYNIYMTAVKGSTVVQSDIALSNSRQNFTISDTLDYTHFRIGIVVQSGQTLNNLVFKPMIRLATDTDATYEPYTAQTVTIALNDTRYGGTLDVGTGVLTVDRGYALINGDVYGLTHNGSFPNNNVEIYVRLPRKNGIINLITNRFHIVADGYDTAWTCHGTGTSNRVNFTMPHEIATKQDAVNWFTSNPTEIVYELAEPFTVQLTANEISTVLGQNNIWSDAGTVDVDYRADTKLYIEKLTAPTEDDMIADHAISANTFFMVGNQLFRATTAIASGATITVGTNATKLSLSDALNALA